MMTTLSYHRTPGMPIEAIPEASHGMSTLYTSQPGLRQVGGNPMAQFQTPMVDPNMGLVGQFHGLGLSNPTLMHHAGPMAHLNGPPAYMMSQDGHYVLAPMPAAPSMAMDGYAAAGASQYMTSHGHFGGYMGLPLMPYTPGRPGFQPRLERSIEVPGLENRRGSHSTNESTPPTPFYGAVSHHDRGPRVAGLDRSTYTTPSPQQIGINNLHMIDAKGTALPLPVDRNLEELIRSDPPIPKAVPAVFTPPGQMKTLEQSLENRIPGNRNVYIRGLHPTTDDQLLYVFASRFGPVETSKAIIDTATGACKGFGFAKFYDVRHSELSIRGFHRLGYEVGFARESFNSRLKAEGDELSTNLYISNLPKTIGEMELGAIFHGFEILSSKILRDSMGNSRGVGFARFSSRDICDAVMREYHGVAIGEEGLLMNIRYADTPAQKELKRITAERRQFRTNEYNIGAYGTSLVGFQPTMFSHNNWRRTVAPGSQSLPTTRTSGSGSENRGPSVTGSGSQTDESRCRTNSDEIVATPTTSESSEKAADNNEPAVTSGITHSSPEAETEL